MILAPEEFLKGFYESYYNYAEKHKNEVRQAAKTDATWSDLMQKILEQLAASRGYKQTGSLRGRPGVDLYWSKGSKHVVAIEHENRWDSFPLAEIDNLSRDGSDLKVLITYLNDRDFIPTAVKMANRCEKELTSRAFSGDFLLVLGGDDYDWEGFEFRTRVHPLPIKLREARIV